VSTPTSAIAKRIGILGGGQLGQMLAASARALGLVPVVYAQEEGPATRAASEFVLGAWDDWAALDRFAGGVDVVTYELEHFPAATAEHVAARTRLAPNAASLVATQDRLHEKALAAKVGIPSAIFLAVDSAAAVEDVAKHVGFPCLLKRRFGGYDGRGQARANSAGDFAAAFGSLAGPAIAERLVPFEREVSVIAVRDVRGEVRVYPPTENHHVDGILRWSIAPAPAITPGDEATLTAYATRVLTAFDYVGVVTLEMFQTRDGWLLNELAPRVHNSGHWTIEGAEASQFENHVRAVAGLPLGSTEACALSLMVNLIGDVPEVAALRSVPHANVHLYGKDPRPGRKLGHVSVTGSATDIAEARAAFAKLGLDAG
jgi:5-(carboxyamino)imidazole ribonucleotide synthase